MNSIIVPTYCPTAEVHGYLSQCLTALLHNTALPYTLIVVEQGPRYAEAIIDNWLSTHAIGNHPLSKYVYCGQPLGYAKAVNLAVEGLVETDYFFIVNNDLFVPPNWDKIMLEAYAKLPHGGGVLGAMDRPCHTDVVLDESWWSCVLINRDSWSAVGPLDTGALNFRLHDQDWSIRAKLKGLDVARAGLCHVEHINSATYRHMETPRIETSERAEMRKRYGVEHFHEWIARNPRLPLT